MDDIIKNFGTKQSCDCDDNTIYVQDAIIEEIFIDNRTGYITISYANWNGGLTLPSQELVTLIVGRDTIIRNQFCQYISMWDLREGMIVDAEFSSVMTRSLPPQAQAFRINVVRDNTSTNVMVDRVIDVDGNYGFLFTGNPNDINTQMRFVVNDDTIILDRRGNRINLSNIKPNDTVRVEHASFQTMSIPPQTVAFVIQVL